MAKKDEYVGRHHLTDTWRDFRSAVEALARDLRRRQQRRTALGW